MLPSNHHVLISDRFRFTLQENNIYVYVAEPFPLKTDRLEIFFSNYSFSIVF